ncbi:LysR substrate-binding domain-containing protein [Labrenzia sp. VG12]|uniref:LysR substrate-binding domain-containing protein n=1 Tax=Labrenzia sp. VG12 TaxID=2021862 RepID=UPI0012FE19D8|nr:LysR substrate-binding domain-containing protein [Labrenzia sp. VG12]
MSRIPMSWLATFEAAARHLNFTKAASELGLTQGAVSQQIVKLEQELDAPLFERRGRRVFLTEIGEAYLNQVSGSLADIRSVTEDLFTRPETERVRLACYSPTFAHLWLAPRLGALYADLPGIEIQISVNYQLNPSTPGSWDIVFSYEDLASSSAGFLPLFRERIVAVATPELAALWPSELPGTPCLIQTAGPRGTWQSWLAAAGRSLPAPRFALVNSMHCALQMATGGTGFALGAYPFIEAELESSRLQVIEPEVQLAGRHHGLAVPAGASASQPVRRVVEWIMDAALI